jgi:tripartite-type tricarboxylate transporter receptor subunit TctC
MARGVMTLLAVIAVAVCPGPAAAQSYPQRLIRVIVPLTPGSPIDVAARLVVPRLSERLGQTIVVENRPGGSGSIGAKAVAGAAPDGYTLLLSGVNHAIAPAMSGRSEYDPVRDFTPVGRIATSSWVLVVTPDLPVRSIAEFVAHAKSSPGAVNFGFGAGTGPHLLGELFKAETGAPINSVSYKGGAQAVTDMLGGHVQMNVGTTATLLPLIRDGKLRPLAVTSDRRNPDLPDVPTMAESGLPRLTLSFWVALFGPPGLPEEVTARLSAALEAVLASPELAPAMVKLGFDPAPATPGQLAQIVAGDYRAWGDAAKAAGVTPQ